ncbi:hypothetical protein JI58_08110 [Marinosulfonomonas sp. PRT-SC04]|nr:hypothetical protein JI58_08110 [Marinosulfonomonas sp. PRT-SC04]
MPDNVFKEHTLGRDLLNDPRNIRPEVARIVFALAQPREGERLAGITGSDKMNAAAPWLAVEGFEIVPNRCLIQGRVRHPCHESGRGETVPLNITHGAISGFCDVNSDIKAGNTGAKADASNFCLLVWGVNSHTIGPFRCDLVARVKGSTRRVPLAS